MFLVSKLDKYPNINEATAFFQGVVSLPRLRTAPNTSWMARLWAAFIPSTLTVTPARACRCTVTWPQTREAGLWVSKVSPETQVFSFPDQVPFGYSGVPAAPERPDRFFQEVERLSRRVWKPGGWILAWWVLILLFTMWQSLPEEP